MVWTGWVVGALLLLDVLNLTVYGLVVPASAALVAIFVPGAVDWRRPQVDRRDLAAVAVLYLAVVGLFSAAFRGFTTENTTGLVLCFATGLLLGVAGPVVYTVWWRGRRLRDLGLRADNWRQAAALGVVFAAVQFALTLWGYQLPSPVGWVPLLVMSLVVGFFEAVFFRGFVQARLEESFGSVTGIGGAAVLYGLYHVGYGMGGADMVFLVGLGVVYAVAFALARSVLVVWPLLTPLGSLFNNLEHSNIDLPWASIAGFADVAALMATAIWLAARRQRRRSRSPAQPQLARRRRRL